MSGGWTPGPWEIRTSPRHHTPGLNYREILGGGDREGNPCVLGELYSGFEHDEPEDEVSTGNANLIAAAPDLLEALENLLGQFDQAHDALGVERSQSSREAIADAQTALAKARGTITSPIDARIEGEER